MLEPLDHSRTIRSDQKVRIDLTQGAPESYSNRLNRSIEQTLHRLNQGFEARRDQSGKRTKPTVPAMTSRTSRFRESSTPKG